MGKDPTSGPKGWHISPAGKFRSKHDRKAGRRSSLSPNASAALASITAVGLYVGLVNYFPWPTGANIGPGHGLVGHARVVDGDTLDFGHARVRLEGIDAPEAMQSCRDATGRSWNCGRRAAERLTELMRGPSVRCEGNAKDAYGRVLGTCFVGDQNVNAQMVREGLAWAFVKYSSTYANVEQEARRARRGVFETENVPPWQFRALR